MFFKLPLKTLEQGEGIGRGACKACKNLSVIEAAHLSGIPLHDRVSQGHLSVAAYDDLTVSANRNYGRSMKLFQVDRPEIDLQCPDCTRFETFRIDPGESACLDAMKIRTSHC